MQHSSVFDEARDSGKRAVLKFRAELIYDYETLANMTINRKDEQLDNDPENLYYISKVEDVDNWEDQGKKYLKRHKTLLIDRFDSLTDDEDEINLGYNDYKGYKDNNDNKESRDDNDNKDTNKDDEGKWKQYLEILEEFRGRGKDLSEGTVDSTGEILSRSVDGSKEHENKEIEKLGNKMKNLEDKLERIIELLQPLQ